MSEFTYAVEAYYPAIHEWRDLIQGASQAFAMGYYAGAMDGALPRLATRVTRSDGKVCASDPGSSEVVW